MGGGGANWLKKGEHLFSQVEACVVSNEHPGQDGSQKSLRKGEMASVLASKNLIHMCPNWVC